MGYGSRVKSGDQGGVCLEAVSTLYVGIPMCTLDSTAPTHLHPHPNHVRRMSMQGFSGAKKVVMTA